MAKTLSSMKTKEQTHVKIFNFYVSKKTLVIAGIAIVVLFIIIKYNQAKKQQELEARMMAQTAIPFEEVEDTTEVLSLEEQIQASLRERYGQPAEGFQWDYMGNLVPIANIEDKSAEDILYTYLQSVHMMDLATAQRVAAKSTIIDLVNEYYSDVSNALVGTEDLFKRKLIKLALDKMSIDGITNSIVQANGTYIFSVDITCLDLSNKNFWRNDEQELYKTMFVYDKTEIDSNKKDEYLYDYIYDAYEKELCGFKTGNVDIVVSKANSGGWLVTDDTPLRKLLLYEDGVGLKTYISTQYTDWYVNEGYNGNTTQMEDVGFGHTENAFEPADESSSSVGGKQSEVNQQLQAELEYYKEHGELPTKTTDTTSTDTSDTTETVSNGETTETIDTTQSSTINGATNSTEESQSTSKEQLHIEPIWDEPNNHSSTTGEEVGYGRGQ